MLHLMMKQHLVGHPDEITRRGGGVVGEITNIMPQWGYTGENHAQWRSWSEKDFPIFTIPTRYIAAYYCHTNIAETYLYKRDENLCASINLPRCEKKMLNVSHSSYRCNYYKKSTVSFIPRGEISFPAQSRCKKTNLVAVSRRKIDFPPLIGGEKARARIIVCLFCTRKNNVFTVINEDNIKITPGTPSAISQIICITLREYCVCLYIFYLFTRSRLESRKVKASAHIYSPVASLAHIIYLVREIVRGRVFALRATGSILSGARLLRWRHIQHLSIQISLSCVYCVEIHAARSLLFCICHDVIK